jgi:multicomponent Na+:H+ antiporter subunit C
VTLAFHLTVLVLFCVGVWGMAQSRNLIHLVACLSVTKSSTALLFIGIGYREDAAAPIREPGREAAAVVDPLVQALILVDIVVGAAITALLLALAVEFHRRRGTLDLCRLAPRRR